MCIVVVVVVWKELFLTDESCGLDPPARCKWWYFAKTKRRRRSFCASNEQLLQIDGTTRTHASIGYYFDPTFITTATTTTTTFVCVFTYFLANARSFCKHDIVYWAAIHKTHLLSIGFIFVKTLRCKMIALILTIDLPFNWSLRRVTHVSRVLKCGLFLKRIKKHRKSHYPHF